MTPPSPSPATPEEVQEVVRSTTRLLARGGGSKGALSSAGEVEVLELAGLTGVLEYLPEEFTITARAGARVSDVEALLSQNGQYLPFDPLLTGRGATLGGTVAAGTAGPGRYRYGGVRDFLLGVRFVDGSGRLARGGGKVVKNAAGFDLPKLMVGSLGRLGVLVELCFKVFPRPEARGSLRIGLARLEDALEDLYRLTAGPVELESLDLEPPATLWLRVAGRRETLPRRLQRVREIIGAGEVVDGPQEEAHWRDLREFAWVPADTTLVKVPLTPKQIPPLEGRLEKTPARRIYSCGGQQLWLAWPAELGELEDILVAHGLRGLALCGSADRSLLGNSRGGVFLNRVKKALDPEGRFPGF